MTNKIPLWLFAFAKPDKTLPVPVVIPFASFQEAANSDVFTTLRKQ